MYTGYPAPGNPPLQGPNVTSHTQYNMAAKEEGNCCSICLGEYKDPRVLPCQHVFCLQCLCDYVANKKQINCPNCMKKIEIPPRGVAALQKFVGKPLHKTTEVCNVCEKGIQASFQCFECDKCMCDGCKKCHDVFSSEHQVHTLQASDPKKSFCENHPNVVLQFYCKTCKCLICKQCTSYSSHNSHVICGIEEYFTQFKTPFNKYQKIIDAKLRKISEVSQSFISKETKILQGVIERVPKLEADFKACKEIACHREKINSKEDKILSKKLTAAIKHLDKALNQSENIRELLDLCLDVESKINAHRMYFLGTNIHNKIEDEIGTLDVTMGRLFSFPSSANSFESQVFLVGGIHWTIKATHQHISNNQVIALELNSFVKKEDKEIVNSVTTDLVFTYSGDSENSFVKKQSKTFSPISPNAVSSNAFKRTQETSERLVCNLFYCQPMDQGRHLRIESKILQILFDIKQIEYKKN